MWTENVQLAIASDDMDMDLYIQFANNRIEEAGELVREGRSEDLGDAVIGYQLRIELLTQAMVHIQAEDPDEAVKLRLDLEEKLQGQARIMQSFIEDEEAAEETDDQLREQIRLMLETNTQLRNRINDVEDIPMDEIKDLGVDVATPLDVTALEVNEDEAVKIEDEAANNAGGAPSMRVNDETGTLIIGLGGSGGNGVYAEINGSRYDCVVESGTAACSTIGAPQKGNVNIYDRQTNQFLYSYSYEFEYAFDYDYEWEGEKNDNGNTGGQEKDNESGKGTDKNGKGN